MSIKLEPAMKRLAEISELMNDEDIPLEKAMKLYTEASELAALCKTEMSDAQLNLKELFFGDDA